MGVYLDPKRQFNGKVARLPGVTNSVYEAAKKIWRKAERRLAAHPGQPLPGRTTDNASKVVVRRNIPGEYGHIDSEVALEDPRAVSIEFGHYQKVLGRPTGKYTPGLYIVTGAAGIIKGGWGK